MKNQKLNILIYQHLINSIGGAETWLYNFATQLKKYCNIAIIYDIGAPAQLERLHKAGVKTWHSQPNTYWNCDVFIRSLNMWPPCQINAQRYVSVIHSNFGDPIMMKNKFSYTENGLITNYVCASKYAAESFKKLFPDRPIKYINNIMVVPKDRKTKARIRLGKPLKILTMSRFSNEKGLSRMIKVANKMKKDGVKFEWDVYTNDMWQKSVPNTLFKLHKCQLDLAKQTRDADYVAQFSDSESFCYSIHEALAMGTPVLVTDWGGVREWVHDSENGYIFKMDMSDWNSKKIAKRIPAGFDYQSPSSIEDWVDYLNKIMGRGGSRESWSRD